MDQLPAINGVPYKTMYLGDERDLNAVHKRTITILFSREAMAVVHNWRCNNCGSIVFQYYNAAKAVFDGAVNLEDCTHATDHLCKKCNIIFRITLI